MNTNNVSIPFLILGTLISAIAAGFALLFYLERRKNSRGSPGWQFLLSGVALLPFAEFIRGWLGLYNIFGWFIFFASQALIGYGFFLNFTNERRRNAAIQETIQQNSRLSETQSLIDPVTRLPNQRQFESRLREEYQKSLKEHHPVSIMAVGLDDHKTIVNTYEQLGSDAAIQHIAWVLEKSVRDFDLVARTGVDEFHLLLRGTDPQEAALVAERIRQKVEKTPAHWKESQIYLTCSIGVVIVPAAGTVPASPLILMKSADTALLLAHQKGGNRVVISSP